MTVYSPEVCKQVATGTIVFLAWTTTSFLCHECGKMFLQLAEISFLSSSSADNYLHRPFYRFSLAFFLTSLQIVSCILLVRAETGYTKLLQSRAGRMLTASHALATLATNYSMVYIEAASTLAIKLTEPITMAIAHHMVFQTAVPVQTAISIPLIICGALVFTGLNIYQMSDATGVFMAFASNVILTARNITLKKLQTGSAERSSIVLKPHFNISITIVTQVVVVALIYFLEIQNAVPRNCSLLAGLCFISGIFHVAYSYISTTIVLKVMNIVSHSIANIFKRFLVVLLLGALGNRHISPTNVLGLAVAAGGLMVYTYGRTQSETQPKGPAEDDSGRKPLRRKFFLDLTFLALLSVTTVALIGQSTFHMKRTAMADKFDPNIYRESHGLNEVEIPSMDFAHILKAETNPEIREFLSWRLIDHPEDTDRRAKTLTSNRDVIEEAQRILVSLLQDLLGKARHVMLIEIATYENKGDPAITVGEVMLLRRMNVSIVFYCDTSSCTNNSSLSKALEINKTYRKDELVILMQGGGNLVGYPHIDKVRKKIIETFPDRRIIMFSQSIWLHPKNLKDLSYWRDEYSNHSNLVIFLRDRQSLQIAKANFHGVKLILAPDMAFCIGMVPRQMPPLVDIVWLRRGDSESSKYILPPIPTNLSVEIGDWFSWKSNRGKTAMDNSFLIASAGFQFLERGRIVVTDRLHGHILSTLMNIPHVLIDNPPYLKLSSFDRSWTQNLGNTVLVSNGSLALDAARKLLKRFTSYLPSVAPKDKNAQFKTKP